MPTEAGGIGLWKELEDSQETTQFKAMSTLSLLSFPYSDISVNYLPWLLPQTELFLNLFTVLLKYNSINKATIDLKGLQTEMIGILKVSFAFLPQTLKSVTPFCTVIELARFLLNHLLLYFQ